MLPVEAHKGLLPLASVCEYRNEKPLHVFLRNFDMPMAETTDVFTETLKWIWLGRVFQLDSPLNRPDRLVVFPSLQIIDEMWHSFIICTKDYSNFCLSYLGAYVHHEPDVTSAKTLSSDLLYSNALYVIEKMGARTAMRWYGVYSELYGPDRLRTLKRGLN